MKKTFLLSVSLLLFSISLVGHTANASDASNQNWPKAAESGERQTAKPPKLSRKCGIHNGICMMAMPAEVGSYCWCHNPYGMNYGVIVP